MGKLNNLFKYAKDNQRLVSFSAVCLSVLCLFIGICIDGFSWSYSIISFSPWFFFISFSFFIATREWGWRQLSVFSGSVYVFLVVIENSLPSASFRITGADTASSVTTLMLFGFFCGGLVNVFRETFGNTEENAVQPQFFLNKRNWVQIALLSLPGLTYMYGYQSIDRSRYFLGCPVPFLTIKSASTIDLEIGYLDSLMPVGVLLVVLLILFSPKQFNLSKHLQLWHKYFLAAIFSLILPVVVYKCSKPFFFFLLLASLWLVFWIGVGSMLIYVNRKARLNSGFTAIAGVLDFIYILFVSYAMIMTSLGLKEAVGGFIYTRLDVRLFPIVALLALSLPFVAIVVILRRFNCKRRLFFLIPGAAAWIFISGLPFRTDNLCLPTMIYGLICDSAYYQAQDESLTRKIESRRKKPVSENDIRADK